MLTIGRSEIPEHRSIGRDRRASLVVYAGQAEGGSSSKWAFYSVLIVVGGYTADLHLTLGHQGRSWSHATITGQCSQPIYFGIVKRARMRGASHRGGNWARRCLGWVDGGAESNPVLDVTATAAPDDSQMAPDGLEWL